MKYIVLSQFIGLSSVMGLSSAPLLPPTSLPSFYSSEPSTQSLQCSCTCECPDPKSLVQCVRPCDCSASGALLPTVALYPYVFTPPPPVTTYLPPLTTVTRTVQPPVFVGKGRFPVRTRVPKKKGLNLGELLLLGLSVSHGGNPGGSGGKGPYELPPVEENPYRV